jgi:large subunit ribosomal protein L1
MAKRGKKYRQAAEQIDHQRLYAPEEALELVKKISFEQFDATVDVHIRLGIDARHSDQQVRGTVQLPEGLGKTVRVLVFATGDAAKVAEQAGADFVLSDDESIKKVEDGWTDFDVAIAVPEMMGKVGKLGRVLGPRGLMPNPKTDTVVGEDHLPRVIKAAKAGRIEFRADKTGNVHVPIGKAGFSAKQLLDNLTALVEAISKAKPPATKGSFMRKITVTSCMGPGVKVDPLQAESLEASF